MHTYTVHTYIYTEVELSKNAIDDDSDNPEYYDPETDAGDESKQVSD